MIAVCIKIVIWVSQVDLISPCFKIFLRVQSPYLAIIHKHAHCTLKSAYNHYFKA